MLLKKGTGYSVPSSKLLTSPASVGVDRAACPLFFFLSRLTKRRSSLLLAGEVVLSRHMPFQNACGDSTLIANESVRQSGAGEVRFRLRKDRLLRPSVHGDEQRAARKRDLNRSGTLDIRSFVHAHIVRQGFRGHFHPGFLIVRKLAHPVILPGVSILIANGLDHFRVGNQSRREREPSKLWSKLLDLRKSPLCRGGRSPAADSVRSSATFRYADSRPGARCGR